MTDHVYDAALNSHTIKICCRDSMDHTYITLRDGPTVLTPENLEIALAWLKEDKLNERSRRLMIGISFYLAFK